MSVRWAQGLKADEQPRLADSGIELRPVCGPQDVGVRNPGMPGEPPYTRGVYLDMYRGRLWTMRQYAGMATPLETNARFRYRGPHVDDDQRRSSCCSRSCG